MNWLKSAAELLLSIAMLWLVAGCQTNPNPPEWGPVPSPYLSVPSNPSTNPPAHTGIGFQPGELVVVTFSGVETPPAQHEERVKDDGTITLSLIGPINVKDRTAGQVQKEIRDLYVPKYFQESLNVTVKGQERFFYVGGEVKKSDRYVWSEGMTLVKAIQTAGGLTDYARTSKIRVTRADGKTFTVNYNKALKDPNKFDVPIYPGDSITVDRRGPFG